MCVICMLSEMKPAKLWCSCGNFRWLEAAVELSHYRERAEISKIPMQMATISVDWKARAKRRRQMKMVVRMDDARVAKSDRKENTKLNCTCSKATLPRFAWWSLQVPEIYKSSLVILHFRHRIEWSWFFLPPHKMTDYFVSARWGMIMGHLLTPHRDILKNYKP